MKFKNNVKLDLFHMGQHFVLVVSKWPVEYEIISSSLD